MLDDSESRTATTMERSLLQNLGLAAGALALLIVCASEPPAGMSHAAWVTAGVTVLMALWWTTEALPLAATALVPVALLPMLGAAELDTVGGGYGNSTVFLILGGFLIALAMERWDLHKRIAYSIVLRAGGRPRLLVLGMMAATAFVSMWTSNTSTTLMMIPVALSIAEVVVPDARLASPAERNFAAAIVLCVAYGATIGGLGTLVGTPTNALVVGFMRENYGQTISFAEWLVFGLPTVALLLPLCWLIIVRYALPFELGTQTAAQEAVALSLRELGAMSAAEKRVGCVFVLTAACWIARPLLVKLPGLAALNDTGIALCAGLALFVIPAGGEARGPLLIAAALRRVPWDVLILFGGGLALAATIQDSGLSAAIAQSLTALAGLPLFALTLAITLLLVFWTELNSNVAAAATFTPILAALAAATHYPPLLLVAPAAIAASCGFMLPVGTPPNAIVYGTGKVDIRNMMRAGLIADLASVAVITAVAMTVLPLIVD